MKLNKSLLFSCLLAVSGVAGLAGCAGDRYKQSTGEYIDDKGTNSRVRDALSADGVYKYPDVKVDTFKGTVQLSGFVETSSQKSRATTLAKNVNGVKEVVNNITLK